MDKWRNCDFPQEDGQCFRGKKAEIPQRNKKGGRSALGAPSAGSIWLFFGDYIRPSAGMALRSSSATEPFIS